MHCLCTLVTRRKEDIDAAIASRCYRDEDNEYDFSRWDYAFVGGGYSNIIPANKNSKEVLCLNHPDLMRPPFPEREMRDYLYTSCCRARNINLQEVGRLYDLGFISVLRPYTIIIEDLELDVDDPEEEQYDTLYQFILTHPSYYVTVIDYHI